MLGFGLTVAGIGMGVVFTELVLLVGVIWVISTVTKSMEGKKNAAIAKPAAQQQLQVVTAAPAQTAAAEKEDDNVVAVIAAAVAALSQGTMVIRSITRRPGVQAPSWSLAGRQDTMSLRQI